VIVATTLANDAPVLITMGATLVRLPFQRYFAHHGV
jgi:hypothetical protein